MPHKRRLRWTDWLGLVGLALLLVWTPGYVAQDPNERALTGGETFTLPMPRDGDRATLDLVVTHADGRVERYPNVAELLFDTAPIPEARLAGIPTAGRFVVQYHETNASLGFASYVSPESTMSWWFDESGYIVWRQQDGIHPWGHHAAVADPALATSGHAPGSCQTVGAPNDYAGQTIRYEPELAGALMADFQDALHEMDDRNPCHRRGGAGYLNVVNQAFDTDAGTLYGRHLLRGDRVYDRFTQDPTSDIAMCRFDEGTPVFDRYYGNKYLGSHEVFTLHFEELLRYTRTFESSCDYRDHFERWDWLSPDFGIPVGHHVRHHDQDGNLLFQIDLIPRHIERGDGAPIPVEQRPTDAHLRSDTPDTPVRPITQRLDAVEKDPAVHLMNRTLGQAAAEVRARATGALQSFLAEETHVVAFMAATNGSAVQTGQRSSVWVLTFAQPDGDVRTALLTATWSAPPPAIGPGALPTVPQAPTPQPVAGWTYQVQDACNDPDTYVPANKYCTPVDPARVSPDRRIVSLAGLLADIDAFADNGRGTVREPGRDTFSRLDFDAINTTRTVSDAGTPQLLQRPTLAWQIAHESATGTPSYQAEGDHDLDTGAARGFFRATTPEAPNRTPVIAPSTAAAEAYRMDPLVPVTTAVAWSGVVLLAFSALARAWVAARAGTLPALAALYAKIRKEDVLLHERRDGIIDALRAEPGLTAKELAAVLDAGWGATVHHLETLQRSGLVARVVVGRNRHHFLAKETTPQERRLIALRRDPAYAAFLDAVVSQPGRSLDEIAAAVPRGLSGLSRTGSRLARDGVLEKRKEGRTVRFYPVTVGAVGDHNR